MPIVIIRTPTIPVTTIMGVETVPPSRNEQMMATARVWMGDIGYLFWM